MTKVCATLHTQLTHHPGTVAGARRRIQKKKEEGKI
jgi:hypothetical protein